MWLSKSCKLTQKVANQLTRTKVKDAIEKGELRKGQSINIDGYKFTYNEDGTITVDRSKLNEKIGLDPNLQYLTGRQEGELYFEGGEDIKYFMYFMRVHTGGRDLGAGLYEHKEGTPNAKLIKQWLANREGRATLIELTKDEPAVRKAMETPSMWNTRISVSSKWADKAKKTGGESEAGMPENLPVN